MAILIDGRDSQQPDSVFASLTDVGDENTPRTNAALSKNYANTGFLA